jgi:signal transduction histidine kinase
VRPLDRIPSIKLKLGALIVAAVVVAAGMSALGYRLGWPLWARPTAAALVSLGMVQVLAKGMTRPLREMERAATAMAQGDHSQRVATQASDEVGRLAVAFNTMADELAETERQRRELAANVSHELRTPIAGLQATLENLIDGVAVGDIATYEAMHHQTLRLGRLVRDLLELSRLESGATTLELADTELEPLARRVVDEARAIHPDVAIDLVVADRPISIEADAQRLHQVMTNLVDNAARHGGGTPVTVTLERNRDAAGFSVADRGVGIPSAERSRVFERFHRLDPSRVRDRGGAGLGLAIAQWIVELHHGRIVAAESPGGGCRMEVLLPHRHLATPTTPEASR